MFRILRSPYSCRDDLYTASKPLLLDASSYTFDVALSLFVFDVLFPLYASIHHIRLIYILCFCCTVSPPQSLLDVAFFSTMHCISKLLAGSIVAFGAARTVAAGVKFAGVNIAGFDFGCTTDVILAFCPDRLGFQHPSC